ncbi:MAG: energy-coupling factor ABC transporter ATP-binding protein [Candidatus Nezhaarchaeota archaeon]|nr:energy-coupling factor ABC transporter ATP-binding protein [Candidatus Nezhaarchaeota archaeon]MCX8141210.1 energy-coupling factor ABC transporter ATP-binding protein [Candidatus Nezhaarchaeota archaeon]MDW8049476.1 ABC transporter ATP-binding protein [Nitrososphaerota archaeon]
MSGRELARPVIEIENASYTYPDGTPALRSVNIKILEGSIVAITGANGAGKSTLLMLMAGLLDPQEGQVKFRGVNIKKIKHEVRRELGIVFQDPDDQLFAPTIYDDIAFGLRLLKLSEDEIRVHVQRIACELGVEHLLNKPPYRLSGGEKRRAALATTLILNPSILLLDEPFSDLTPQMIEQLANLIVKLKDEGKTVVFTSHDVDLVAELSDYVCVMAKGRVIAQGRPEEVLCDDDVLSRAELKPPTAAIIYRELVGSYNNGKYPIRMSEALSMLKRLYYFTRHASTIR